MELIKKIFTQTSWQIVGKGVTSLSTVIILGLVTRKFGEAGTGVFTLALTYLAFFTLAIDFGLNAYILPHLIRDNDSSEWQQLFGFRIILAGFFTVLSILIVIIWPIDPQFKQLVLIGALFSNLESAVFISANAIFQARLRYDLSTFALVSGTILTTILIFFGFNNQTTLVSLIYAFILGWIIIIAASLLLLQKHLSSLRPVFDSSYLLRVFKITWPISLTLILNTVYFRVDAFILSFFGSFAAVGIYNVAYAVFQAALFIPAFIINSFYPMMLASLEKSQNHFLVQIKKAMLSMFALGLLATLLTFYFAPQIISLITGGKGFDGSAASLQVLSLGFPAFFLSAITMWALISLKKYKKVLATYAVGLVINIVLNLVLIPQFSYLGASWVTGISEYLILAIQLVILWKEFRVGKMSVDQ